MGINHLVLSPEIIRSLYPDSLVDFGEVESIPFLGKNKRSVCILCHYSEGEFLPGDQFAFLQKMLNACNYSLDDIALVNIAGKTLDITELKRQLEPQILFLWGIRTETAGYAAGLPEFDISLVEGISVIPVPRPDVLSSENAESTELKKRLWACLKKIFGL
jgi:hypothetical protein